MKRLILVLIYLFIILFSCYADDLKMPAYVAHGGGSINGEGLTNSLEALNFNYKRGFRFFEIDFEWTSDSELVLIHDWEENLERLFQKEPHIYSLEDFKSFRMKDGLTQMSLKDLADWLRFHPDAYIITDIKSENIKGLRKISEEYPDLKMKFVPQIYRFEEYEQARDMGFENIVLTLYRADYSNEEVIDFLRTHNISALTMWYYRATPDFITTLKKIGIFVYVHTVNDISLHARLKYTGVDGFYTDSLGP